jgi:hypothetical protein
MEVELGTALKNRRIVTIDLTKDDRETEFQIKHTNTTISLSLKPTKSLSLKRKQPEPVAQELEKLNSVVISISNDPAPEAKRQCFDSPNLQRLDASSPVVSKEIKAWLAQDKATELSNLAKLRRAVGKLGLTGKNVDFVFDNRLLGPEFLTLVDKSPEITRSMVTHAASLCAKTSAKFYPTPKDWASVEKKIDHLQSLGFHPAIAELLITAMVQLDETYLKFAPCSELAQDLIAVCERLVCMGVSGEIVPNIVSKAVHDPSILMLPAREDDATPVWVEALGELRDVKNPATIKLVGANERQRQLAKADSDPTTPISTFVTFETGANCDSGFC